MYITTGKPGDITVNFILDPDRIVKMTTDYYKEYYRFVPTGEGGYLEPNW